MAGNLIGTDWTGTRTIPNDVAIDVRGSGNRIGTNVDGVSDAFERNVISGNIVTGILIIGDAATGTVVQGNFVGVDSSGTDARQRRLRHRAELTPTAIELAAASRQPVPVYEASGDDRFRRFPVPPTAGNVISGNGRDGIHLDYSHDNVIQGNHIGVDYLGLQALATAASGSGWANRPVTKSAVAK